MRSTPQATSDIAFGRFRVLPHRRELLLDGRPVKMGGRAFDVLMALIEAPGVVVTKDELIARVWPGRIVEENALQWQITALRKALGADRDLIRTVSGRGYQFTGEIQLIAAGRDLDPAIEPIPSTGSTAERIATNLSQPISGLIGRDGELAELVQLVGTHRLVTLTGPGGIGKTRLSQEAARRLLSQFADGVWFVELAPLAHPDLVAAAIAATAGVTIPAGLVSAERVAAALADKTLLIVLDNCEHVIDGAALIVDALLHAAPNAHVLATSREPLRTEGEQVYPIRPLAVPSEDAGQADDPGRYGAVQLFLERARAADAHFAPDRRSLETIGAICRRLDGIPLAIELAAARTAVIGVEDLAGRLDQCFHLLTSGRRTALPRHRTLRATLDWSHDLLTVAERVLLRRLAIFAGSFSLEAVQAVTPSAELPGWRSSRALPAWWRSLSSWRTSRPVRRGTGCSRRRGPMHAKSLPRPPRSRHSRGVTPNTTETFSSARKPSRRRGTPANGWPITDRGSTIYGPRSTGPSPRTAIRRSAWR